MAGMAGMASLAGLAGLAGLDAAAQAQVVVVVKVKVKSVLSVQAPVDETRHLVSQLRLAPWRAHRALFLVEKLKKRGHEGMKALHERGQWVEPCDGMVRIKTL